MESTSSEMQGHCIYSTVFTWYMVFYQNIYLTCSKYIDTIVIMFTERELISPQCLE